MRSSRSFFRSPQARVWRTAVPQNNRHVGGSVPGPLEETGQAEEAISVILTMANAGHRMFSWMELRSPHASSKRIFTSMMIMSSPNITFEVRSCVF